MYNKSLGRVINSGDVISTRYAVMNSLLTYYHNVPRKRAKIRENIVKSASCVKTEARIGLSNRVFLPSNQPLNRVVPY